MEDERLAAKQREEEEKRKRAEEDKRRALETQRQASLSALKNQGGTATPFVYKECYDFDATCFLVGDFTNWEPIAMVREGDSLDFTLTVPLPSGQHLFYYVVNDKREIDKLKPTGFGNGVLCNRLNV